MIGREHALALKRQVFLDRDKHDRRAAAVDFPLNPASAAALARVPWLLFLEAQPGLRSTIACTIAG